MYIYIYIYVCMPIHNISMYNVIYVYIFVYIYIIKLVVDIYIYRERLRDPKHRCCFFLSVEPISHVCGSVGGGKGHHEAGVDDKHKNNRPI